MTGTPTAKRNASTARRSRRDRHHYLAGYLAGVAAGLKEAQSILGGNLERYHVAPDFGGPGATCKDGWESGFTDATLFGEAAIRARIAEIEAEDKAP